jgi:hypothetical protein
MVEEKADTRWRVEAGSSGKGSLVGVPADQEARAVLASTLPVPLHDLQTILLPRSRTQPLP